MKRLWFITNPNSGSADHAKAEALGEVFVEHGLEIVGRTGFPEEELPTEAELASAKADTAVLFAGDGTINAAVCALATWDGAILILPGGTMNMLAKTLHGNLDPAAIIAKARHEGRIVALSYVDAGEYRALVGMIVGPAANWFRPRELARERKLAGLLPAMRAAWRRTFGRGIRLSGAPGLEQRLQGAYVRAEGDHLEVAAVDARDFRSIADLGWNWVAGDWAAAHAVTEVRAQELRIDERRPVLALFDGEPQRLDPGTRIRVGHTLEQFIATDGAAE
jgi:diacylglycerol kinase family enzyme